MTGVRRIAALGAIVTVAAISLGGASSVASTKADPNYQPLSAAERQEIASVTPATLAAIGSGGQSQLHTPRHKPWHKLTSGGKPELGVIVADFCPFCAAEQWSIAVALSRFGQLHGLTTISSTSMDPVYPSIKSASFRYAKFHSKYLSVDAVVNEGVKHQTLQPVPKKLKAQWVHYDGRALGYPFLDFGGKVVLTLPSFDPSVLSGLSRVAIAAQLTDKTSNVAQAIDGAANQITAAICVITKNKPKQVCGTKTITTIERHLK